MSLYSRQHFPSCGVPCGVRAKTLGVAHSHIHIYIYIVYVTIVPIGVVTIETVLQTETVMVQGTDVTRTSIRTDSALAVAFIPPLGPPASTLSRSIRSGCDKFIDITNVSANVQSYILPQFPANRPGMSTYLAQLMSDLPYFMHDEIIALFREIYGSGVCETSAKC